MKRATLKCDTVAHFYEKRSLYEGFLKVRVPKRHTCAQKKKQATAGNGGQRRATPRKFNKLSFFIVKTGVFENGDAEVRYCCTLLRKTITLRGVFEGQSPQAPCLRTKVAPRATAGNGSARLGSARLASARLGSARLCTFPPLFVTFPRRNLT